jgi:hypothetical protein
MFPRRYILTLVVLASFVTFARAQDNNAPVSGTESTASDKSIPADDTEETTSDNATNSAQSQTDPSIDRRSFFTADLHASEDAESNIEGTPGNLAFSSVANALAGVHLLSLQHRSESAIDYLGGGQFYNSNSYAVQQLNAQQRFLWRRTVLTFADEFGQLPGGSFGAAWFGGVGLYNLGTEDNAIPPTSSISGFFGASDLTGITQNPRISNVSLVQLSQVVTPRSSFSITGGYGETNYSRSELTNLNLINNQELGGQLNYSYALTRRDQVGFLCSFRRYQFPGPLGGNVSTSLGQIIFAHQLSSRVKVDVAVGPEFTRLSSVQGGLVNQLGASGHASLSYLFRKSSLSLSYDRGVTSGSGLFVGANSDTAQFSVVRRYREFGLSVAAGYSRLSQLGQPSLGTVSQSYQYGFAGAGVYRQLGRYVSASAGYQFSDQSFSKSFCVVTTPCSLIGQGHTFSVGIDVAARPRRLE